MDGRQRVAHEVLRLHIAPGQPGVNAHAQLAVVARRGRDGQRVAGAVARGGHLHRQAQLGRQHDGRVGAHFVAADRAGRAGAGLHAGAAGGREQVLLQQLLRFVVGAFGALQGLQRALARGLVTPLHQAQRRQAVLRINSPRALLR